MRVLVRHGHFAFYPKTPEDIARFCAFFDVVLEREEDFYTFPKLKDAPRYSLIGALWLTLPATATYEGRNAWEIMRENGFVYSIELAAIVPKLSITQAIDPPASRYYFIAESPLIQPGSRNALGQQVLSYDAEFDFGTKQLRVREIGYE